MILPSALLIARAQLGDREALNELLHLVERPLLGHINSIVTDPDDALDVLQRVLLSIATRVSSLRDLSLFRAWCYRIATRAAVRHRRGNEKWMAAARDEQLATLAAETDEPRFDAAALSALSERVKELPPASQLVIRMRYYEELSYEEISEALDIAIGTVKSRLAYGRGLLRRMLSAE